MTHPNSDKFPSVREMNEKHPAPAPEHRIHVIPIGDVEIHAAQEVCWCHPLRSPKEPHRVSYIHHAKDIREAYERSHLEGIEGKPWVCIAETMPVPVIPKGVQEQPAAPDPAPEVDPATELRRVRRAFADHLETHRCLDEPAPEAVYRTGMPHPVSEDGHKNEITWWENEGCTVTITKEGE